MKKALTTTAKFIFLLFVDAVGSLLYHPFGIQSALSGAEGVPRTFVWDGIILTLSAYILLLVVDALRRRLKGSGALTTLALILAIFAGYLLKLGFLTHNW